MASLFPSHPLERRHGSDAFLECLRPSTLPISCGLATGRSRRMQDDDRTGAPTVGRAPAAAPFSANALPVGTRLHEFEIVRLVGEGGFGIVYLAHDCVLGRRVALK